MIEHTPPKLALWLLKHGGSPYHRESLEGDLMEQYQEGRSRAWYWRQVVTALVIAQGQFIRAVLWSAVARVLFRFLAEAAAVIAVLAVADRARRAHSFAELMNGGFMTTLALLIAVGSFSVAVLVRMSKRRHVHGLANTLMLVLGVIALGVGTVTWAQSVRSDACHAAACACPAD
jgi:hypothetical protein